MNYILLEEARKEIEEGEEKLVQLETGEWYVLGRDTVQNSVEFGMDAERIGAIGKVFPVIFFLVAALVSLTSMTRMIEEERTIIGTMKALGYSKIAVAAKYILYAASATIIKIIATMGSNLHLLLITFCNLCRHNKFVKIWRTWVYAHSYIYNYILFLL